VNLFDSTGEIGGAFGPVEPDSRLS
jgi:hypothetical protein